MPKGLLPVVHYASQLFELGILGARTLHCEARVRFACPDQGVAYPSGPALERPEGLWLLGASGNMVGAQYRKGGRDIATAVLPAQFEGANVKVPQFRALALGIKEADKRSSGHVADEAQVI